MSDLVPIAEKIFKLKYAQENESWASACARIAGYVGQEDSDEDIGNYFQLIYNKVFIPGGRILANAGTGIKNLMNCFVLPLEDSREGIYETLKNAAEIFAWGGGIGYDFSKLREENSPVITTGGNASGPLSFMSLFDQTGEVISQASRRGAQMGILKIDHPDIVRFIKFKSDLNKRNSRLLDEFLRNSEYYDGFGIVTNGDWNNLVKTLEKTLADDQLTHFNISVSITDDFMQAVEKYLPWELISRFNGEVYGKVNPNEIFDLLAQKAWESGDPGVFFWDRTNEDNMVPYIGDLDTTNPCGEVPLLSYEPCCLGSLNLHSFYDPYSKKIDYEFLEFAVRHAIKFLDNVQEISHTQIDRVNYYSKNLRRLGLGVMGWADLLAEMEIPYDSKKAFDLALELSWFISYFSWMESIKLAMEKGPFPLYDKEKANLNVVERVINSDIHSYKHNMEEVRELGVRNVSVTSIAPTGTIALIAGVNSSIEPFFSLAYKRNITEGVGNIAKDFVIEVNPILFKKLEELELTPEQIDFVKEYVYERGSVQECELVPEHLQKVFKTSHEIHWKDHIKMQASWQTFVTNAVSKTINMPEDATVEDIKEAYETLWALDCKGGTIYRDNSKTFQILNSGIK